MPKLVVRSFALSLDGFSAAPRQTLKEPFGRDGIRLMNWAFATKHFGALFGAGGGAEGVDNDFLAKADQNIGASIMGRHMFGPPADVEDKGAWRGWWGEEPVYHHPVFVLTHEKKAPLPMQGGTTFTFVNDGIESALKQAFAAAQGKDVRLAGGAATVRQYLQAGLVDEMHLVFSPVLLGQGESMLHGLDLLQLGFEVAEHRQGEGALHMVLKKRN